MQLHINSDELDKNTGQEQLTGLAHVLRAFLDFIQKLQGQSEPIPEVVQQPESEELPPDDPFGALIIQKLKRAQQQASRPARRASGWMNMNFPREINDRHI